MMNPADTGLSPSSDRLVARLRRSPIFVIASIALLLVGAACFASLPLLVSPRSSDDQTPRYNAGDLTAARLPPALSIARASSPAGDAFEPAREQDSSPRAGRDDPGVGFALLGTDALGRSLLYRCLVGGSISLTVGIAAAAFSVLIGTLYGSAAALAGGWVDSVMMRFVDVLYGLPYVLLVVLFAVAVDAGLERIVSSRVSAHAAASADAVDRELASLPADRRSDPAVRLGIERSVKLRAGTGEISTSTRNAISIVTMLVAIGGVSWLTTARVVRGQVLSLRARPFVEAARAVGAAPHTILVRHIFPNLVGAIVVYGTLTVPQAILQESFLSFLGIGIRPPLPTWGNLAAEGLSELNPYRSHWWLLLFPCVLLGTTLVLLNFVGEGLRDAMDPTRKARA